MKIDEVLAAAQALVDALSLDVNGIPGMPFSGNGGLVSNETIKASDKLRLTINRFKKEATG